MNRLFSKPLRIGTITRRLLKTCIHVGISGYLTVLFYYGVSDQLGADPVKTLIHNSGLAAVVILLTTLSLSPIAKYLPCGDLMKFRRLLGLYVFFTALFHLLIYTFFDLQLNIRLLLDELIRRPYITIGMVTLLILFVLSITSFDYVKRKMGRKWQSLHNYVYLALCLALLHFSWSEKTLLQSSIYYWAIGLFLLSFRFNKIKR